ncbi:MAG: hypothetical protein WKG01_10920 [Kofleriaceae bacterium]
MRFLVAVALLLSVTPGMAEVIETTLHVIAHGDLPHHEELVAEQGCSEHTCTPLAHHCDCHTQMSAQTSLRVANVHAPRAITQLKQPALKTASDRTNEPPPLRPPIG